MSDWPTSVQNLGGAITMDYIFNSSTSNADPGSGKFALNNATETSATAAYVDLTSHDNIDLTTVLANLTNSTNTNKAFLRIVKKNALDHFILFYITGTTSHSGYREFAISEIAGSGASAFVNGDECFLIVDQIGDTGGGGGGGAFTLISDQLLGSDTAVVTFSSIANTFKHLMLLCNVRSTGGVVNDTVRIRFNNDSGSNYDDEILYTTNTGVAHAEESANSKARLLTCPGASSARAASGGPNMAYIYDYASTTFEKTFTGQGGDPNPLTGMVAGFWRNTAAINRIDIFVDAGNVKAGSRLTLYGLS